MEPGFKLSAAQQVKLEKMTQRRAKGEPIAYILGYKDFCGLRFFVNKDVLIPRPETEKLVELVVDGVTLSAAAGQGPWILKQVQNDTKKQTIKILDVGTGSGCIPIAIAKTLQAKSPARPTEAVQSGRYKLQPSFTASDISKTALIVARKNAKAHKAKIKFIQSDLFNNVNGVFDIITANLPYIPMKVLRKHLLHKVKKSGVDDPFAGLSFEPKFALTDSTSVWLIYKRFFEQVAAHIHEKSVIILETDPASRKFLTEYQKKYLPTRQMKFYKDFRGLWRFAVVR